MKALKCVWERKSVLPGKSSLAEVRCGSSQLTIGQRSNCPVIHSPINAFYVFLMSFVMAMQHVHIYTHTNICVATYTLLAVDILSTSSLLCKWSLQTCAFSLTALPLWLSISHFFKEFMLFLMKSHYIASFMWSLCQNSSPVDFCLLRYIYFPVWPATVYNKVWVWKNMLMYLINDPYLQLC